MLLSLQPGTVTLSTGSMLIIAACLCWAVDNSLTRKVSTHDALLVACLKGLFAGATNTGLAWTLGTTWPDPEPLLAVLVLGFAGYGLSLALFVVALRGLGAARTGAYVSVAPLFGVLVSLLTWPAWPGGIFWVATGLMGIGVWLHIRERHEHDHTHQPLDHAHAHVYDAHHRHEHDFAWDGVEPHVHPHRHAVLTHRHAHFPDVHHPHPH